MRVTRISRSAVMASADLTQRQVGGDQRHAQSAGGQHHHDLWGMGQVGKEFGVPGERDACFVDHAFMHRGGDHAGEVAIHAALCGAGQGLQHKGCVGLVQLAGGNRGIQRGVPHIQATCRSWLFGPVARPHR
jgi:hypothetical protein